MTTPFSRNFGGHVRIVPGNTCFDVSNLKSVALTVLELPVLAFNTKKLGGHVTLATPPFGKVIAVLSGVTLGTRVSNLKSVALTILELLAFNSHFWPTVLSVAPLVQHVVCLSVTFCIQAKRLDRFA